jgi:hypothetical protein
MIGLFLIVHIGNHLVGLSGQAAHQAYMTAARSIYRQPLVEAPLIVLLLWQIGSGLTMVARGWKSRKGAVAWLQALSGLYLAFFLLNHVGAVMGGRHVLGLDTDFRFAAAGFFVAPWQLFFAPYYFLALVALGAHVGCAFYWLLQSRSMAARQAALWTAVAVGAGLGLAFVLMLSGALFSVDIPAEYRATYGAGA